MARGRYGALVVEERDPPEVDREELLIPDDWRLADDASLEEFPPLRIESVLRASPLVDSPVLAQGRSLATRKPTLMSENPSGFLTRLAGRLARGRLSQEPPRIMRCRHAASGSTAEPSEGAPS